MPNTTTTNMHRSVALTFSTLLLVLDTVVATRRRSGSASYSSRRRSDSGGNSSGDEDCSEVTRSPNTGLIEDRFVDWCGFVSPGSLGSVSSLFSAVGDTAIWRAQR